jgi:hypothetical protein
VPRAQGGTLAVGPGEAPRLYLFFATWDRQVTDLSRQLEALNSYQRAAAASGLPALTAIDEASVEPSARTLPAFTAKLPHSLSYPIGVDRSGQMADGYGVQDEPWLVLVSPSGRILWYYDVSTAGWLGRVALKREVHNALARAPQGPPRAIAGSPSSHRPGTSAPSARPSSRTGCAPL